MLDIHSSSTEKEAELQALSRSQAVIYFQTDGTILDANENFLDTVGYGIEEIRGKHHSMFVSPDYAEGDEYAQFWRRLSTGEPFSAVFQRFGKGGSEIWLQAVYIPIPGADGRIEKVAKYATDITDRKNAEAETQSQVDAVLRSFAVIEFQPDGTIITANQNFLDAVGYTLDEIQGRHHRIFVEQDEAARPEYTAFWDQLAAGQFAAHVFKRLKKDRSFIWLQASYNPILDPNGRVLKVIKYATDATEIIETSGLADATLGSVQSVAAAVEKMTVSIEGICRNMTQSRQSTEKILNDTAQASTVSDELKAAMSKTRGVVDMIHSIASKVNLLALNAAIEAAHAGEAGKGFAVVAAEVKALANQTSAATEDITNEIKKAQAVALNVARNIENISSSAQSVNGAVSAVSSAMEEQTLAVNQIADDAQKMADSVDDIARRIKKLSSV